MELPTLSLLALQHVAMPAGAKTNFLAILRWIHILAGAAWLGSAYFTTLVRIPGFNDFSQPGTRFAGIPHRFAWFRWASVITVLAGIYYWMVLVAAEHRANGTASGRIIGSFFGIWTLAFVLEMGILMMGKLNRNGWALALVFAAIFIAAGWSFLRINSDVQSNSVLAIGVGGGLGWVMMFNLWGIIWRMQKKLWHGMESGVAPVSGSVDIGRLAYVASLTNFWLSFPMLFFMNASQHYILFGA